MKAPRILSVSEIQSLLSALDVRERTLVLLDVCTGIRARMSSPHSIRPPHNARHFANSPSIGPINLVMVLTARGG